jgi:hypothetical protein
MTAAESTIYYTSRADYVCEYRSPKPIPMAKNIVRQRS